MLFRSSRARPTGSSAALRICASGAEFFNPVVFASIAIFAANNFWLKREFHNWFTGKLSDVAFCFFFPAYMSVLLQLVTRVRADVALRIAVAVTVTFFAAVKTIVPASRAMDSILSPLSGLMLGHRSHNLLDITDLIALVTVPVAYWFCRQKLTITEMKQWKQTE